MPILTAYYRNFFFFFFGFVVCRFCTGKRCFGYFRLRLAMKVFVLFWFVIKKKPKKKVLVDKFWEDPLSTKTKHVLVNPKGVTKTCFIAEVLQCRWGCLYSITLFKSICSITNPRPTCLKYNSIKNGIFVPPRRVVLPSSPHLLSVPPACHSLPR